MGKEEGTVSSQEMQKLLQETSSLDVLIYSDSKANIERCKKELEAKLEESYVKKKIDEYKEIVKTLTPNEVSYKYILYYFACRYKIIQEFRIKSIFLAGLFEKLKFLPRLNILVLITTFFFISEQIVFKLRHNNNPLDRPDLILTLTHK